MRLQELLLTEGFSINAKRGHISYGLSYGGGFIITYSKPNMSVLGEVDGDVPPHGFKDDKVEKLLKLIDKETGDVSVPNIENKMQEIINIFVRISYAQHAPKAEQLEFMNWLVDQDRDDLWDYFK